MFRKGLVIVVVAMTGCVAWTATSYATASHGGGVSTIPAMQRPAVELSPALSSSAASVLGAQMTARMGITPASYEAARSVTTQSGTALYLLEGTSGYCLVIASGDKALGSSCGTPGTGGSHVISLLTEAASGLLVGGGVTDGTVTAITMRQRGAAAVSASVRDGAFAVTPQMGVAALHTNFAWSAQ